MAGARVVAGPRGLTVVGHGQIVSASGAHEVPPQLAAPVEVAGPASLASLKTAIARWVSMWSPLRGFRSRDALLWLTELPARAFDDPLIAPREDVELWLDDNQLLIRVAHFFDLHKGEPDVGRLLAMVTPTIASRGGEAVQVWLSDDQGDHPGYYMLEISIAPRLRGAVVADAYKLGKDVLALLDAADDGDLTFESALALLRADRPEALIGQQENLWLDCKQAPYQRDNKGRLELAKDAAAFANADGGVILVGAATSRSGDGEAVARLAPVAAGLVNKTAWVRVIENRVYPPIDGLDVFRIVRPTGELWIVVVPPQPHEMKPFIVHGAAPNKKLNDMYVSVVTRRDDATASMAPAALHSLIVAGRAALRGSSAGAEPTTPGAGSSRGGAVRRPRRSAKR